MIASKEPGYARFQELDKVRVHKLIVIWNIEADDTGTL